MCAGGVLSILLLPLVSRCQETIYVCIWRMFVFMSVVVSVCVNVFCVAAIVEDIVFLPLSVEVCCMFVYGMCWLHYEAVLNAALCMTCSLFMPVEDARGDHIEESYSRVGLMNALEVAMSISFCLPHPVAVSGFIICKGLCGCTVML